jgi:hypothetical protein
MTNQKNKNNETQRYAVWPTVNLGMLEIFLTAEPRSYAVPQCLYTALIEYCNKWRIKGMANCAYIRGAKLCKSRIFILQLNRHFAIIFFEILRRCLFVYTTCEFNDEIMKIRYLNKKNSYEKSIDEFASHEARKSNFQSLKLTL